MWELNNGKIYVESIEEYRKEVLVWRLCFMVPKGEKTYLGKFKKRWFGPFKVQYCLRNNIILIIYVNNFEPNPILVNVNKLKPYTYVDQIVKGIESS
jgi:hypothetical protein